MYRINRTIIIIDPLGDSLDHPNDKMIRQSITDAGYKLKLYHGRFQMLTSTHCGFFSIYVAKMIQACHPKTIAQVEALVNHTFGRTADIDDEHVIADAFGGDEILDSVRQVDQQHGQGLKEMYRFVKRHVLGIKQAAIGTRNNFEPAMRSILSTMGNTPINTILIVRRPIKTITKLVNVFGSNKHDMLYHLLMVINNQWILEKRQELNMSTYQPQSIDQNYNNVIQVNGITTNQLLNNAINQYGNERIYHYSALKYNCQQFIIDLLTASNIPIDTNLKSFIYQDVNGVVPKPVEKFLNFGTDLKNKMDLITRGYGLVNNRYIKI